MKFETKPYDNAVAKGIAMTLISFGMQFEAIPLAGGAISFVVGKEALGYLPSDAGAKMTEVSDEFAQNRGEALATAFGLKRDTEHRDRYCTTYGTKTATGIFAVAQHILSAGN